MPVNSSHFGSMSSTQACFGGTRSARGSIGLAKKSRGEKSTACGNLPGQGSAGIAGFRKIAPKTAFSATAHALPYCAPKDIHTRTFI